jgi:hypothetical protein
MVEGYGFEVIDASHPIEDVFDDLKGRVARLVNSGASLTHKSKD